MSPRYVPLALMTVALACAKSGERRAADSAATPSAAPPSADSAAVRETAVPPATRESVPRESAATSRRDSAAGRRSRLPKGAVTDTGFRPPGDSLHIKGPERRPPYPPLKGPLKVPQESTTRSDTISRDTTVHDTT